MGLSKTHKAYFNAAKDISILSPFPRVKIGAIAVYRHKIISSGYNSTKTAPLQKKYNRLRFSTDSTPHCIHAEIDCLKSLLNRNDINKREIQLYIYREMADGSQGMARPCESCMRFIKDMGIVNIHYTTYDGYASENFII